MKVKQRTNRNNKRFDRVLNPEKVIEMRQLWKDGWRYQQLADMFQVHYETARMAVTGITWKNV